MSTIVLQPARAARTAQPVTPPSGTHATGVLQRLWAALEAHGQRRAAAELRHAAARHAHGDPLIARRLLEAARTAEASAGHTPTSPAQA